MHMNEATLSNISCLSYNCYMVGMSDFEQTSDNFFNIRGKAEKQHRLPLQPISDFTDKVVWK